ncbi:MAG TPA: type 2 isopentenyl-diphosphate Delta-isomerase [Candidatus Bathyarchaeia archaeon]|nr:type 2 isopentenyl-diphosphate Delta-isomerase [Candidatus Bathyarchaeia archaeon]
MSKKTEERKDEHLDICLRENVQARHTTTGFEEIHMIHKALPEINLEEINLSGKTFNHKFSAPLIVESMTGGTRNGSKVNVAIAKAVEELGLGMGVGSQRTAFESTTVEGTFAVTRKEAPNAFIMANIGAPQLAKGYGAKEAKKAVEMLEADALLIHLNPLQEAIQPEGETTFNGVAARIQAIVDGVDIPVIVKEVGCGIGAAEAKQLEALGIAGIDIAGAGGTSWTAVEYFRAKKERDETRQRLGETFWDWGIPTAASLIETTQVVHIPVIASGGLRSGIDLAKALALGASLTGVAYPILDPAFHGAQEAKKKLQLLLDELKTTMFLVGANSVQKLRRAPLIVTGKMADWLVMRGFEPQNYARRDL